MRGLVAGEVAATETEIAWLSRRKERANEIERLRIDVLLRRATARLEVLRAAK